MSITFSGICSAYRDALASQLRAERAERLRLEAKRRETEATQAAWLEEQKRRRTREAVAARMEARRQRQEQNQIVWRTEEERKAALDLQAVAEAKRAIAEQQEQERLDFIASTIMRQQMKRR